MLPRALRTNVRTILGAAATLLAVVNFSFAQPRAEAGIPVTDPLVLAKCGTCHAVDQHGSMRRVSSARATPEGWQDVVRRMIRDDGVSLTPPEARDIVRYLSTRHGLAPDETRPVMYYAERRIRDEAATAGADVRDACSRCHQAARALAWRRTAEDWKLFAEEHAARDHFELEPGVVASLAKRAPLRTPEWDAWSARASMPAITGRWLASVHVLGHGSLVGDVEVESVPGGDEFLTRAHLRAVDGKTELTRTGRVIVYAGSAWRGRSSGNTDARLAPNDLLNETRDVMWISPDGSRAEGRWFWGQYQELGFDVKLQRASPGPDLLLVEPVAFKLGTSANRMRLIGDRFPSRVAPADLAAGPGVTVRRIISSSATEVVAEVDVAKDAVPGRRDVAFRSSTLARAVALYDRVDYVKVVPEEAMATFGDQTHPRGFQQFEAVGYQRGPDDRRHTDDDLELGPIDVEWSMEVFYEIDLSRRARVGTISTTGFFAPAAVNPAANYDVWIIATAKTETTSEGKPLVGKCYLVVTVPTYLLDGRTFVRDLDRWVEEGSPR